MYLFTELTERAQETAVEEFIEDAKAFFGMDTLKKEIVQVFLSKSKVHRYNENGALIGKMTRYQGVETFEPSGMY